MNIKIQSIKYGLMTLVALALAACSNDVSLEPGVNTDASGKVIKQYVSKRTDYSAGEIFRVITSTYNYNSRGQEISFVLDTEYSEPNNGNTQASLEIITTYNAEGKKISRGSYSYEYDAQQRLIKEQQGVKVTRYYYSGEEALPNKVTVHYAYDGKPEEFESTALISYSGGNFSQIDSLNEQDNVISQQFFSYSATDKLLNIQTIKNQSTFINERNQYDQDDRLIVKELGISSVGHVNARTEYSYYPGGELRSKLVKRSFESGVIELELYTYGYVAVGGIKTLYIETDLGADGSVDRYQEVDQDPSQLFDYPEDQQNKKYPQDIEERDFNSNRVLTRLTEFSYSYW